MTRPAPALPMPALPVLLLLLLPAACSRGATPPAAGCEAQIDADPVVRDLITKGAGSEHFKWENEGVLAQARKDAETACLQGRGVLRRGGGVERPQAD